MGELDGAYFNLWGWSSCFKSDCLQCSACVENIQPKSHLFAWLFHLPHWLQWLLSLNLEDLALFLVSGVPHEGQWQFSALGKLTQSAYHTTALGPPSSTTPVSQEPDVQSTLNKHLGSGWKCSHILFSLFPSQTFYYKKFFWTYRKVKWILKKLSKHSNTYHWITFCSVCFTVYLSSSLTINPSYLFLCLSGKLQTSPLNTSARVSFCWIITLQFIFSRWNLHAMKFPNLKHAICQVLTSNCLCESEPCQSSGHCRCHPDGALKLSWSTLPLLPPRQP